jgi:hypothetical protein
MKQDGTMNDDVPIRQGEKRQARFDTQHRQKQACLDCRVRGDRSGYSDAGLLLSPTDVQMENNHDINEKGKDVGMSAALASLINRTLRIRNVTSGMEASETLSEPNVRGRKQRTHESDYLFDVLLSPTYE